MEKSKYGRDIHIENTYTQRQYTQGRDTKKIYTWIGQVKGHKCGKEKDTKAYTHGKTYTKRDTKKETDYF